MFGATPAGGRPLMLLPAIVVFSSFTCGGVGSGSPPAFADVIPPPSFDPGLLTLLSEIVELVMLRFPKMAMAPPWPFPAPPWTLLPLNVLLVMLTVPLEPGPKLSKG